MSVYRSDKTHEWNGVYLRKYRTDMRRMKTEIALSRAQRNMHMTDVSGFVSHVGSQIYGNIKTAVTIN